MRKFVFGSLVLAFTGLIGGTPAFANSGGMGDPITHTREMNAICEAQRHGAGPQYPNMCLPDYAPSAGAPSGSDRR